MVPIHVLWTKEKSKLVLWRTRMGLVSVLEKINYLYSIAFGIILLLESILIKRRFVIEAGVLQIRCY